MEYRTIELVAGAVPGLYDIPREGDTVRDITIHGSFVKATLVVGDMIVWESDAGEGEIVIPYELNLIGAGYHTTRLIVQAPDTDAITVKATYILFEDTGYRRRLADRFHSPWWIKSEAHKYPEKIERLFQNP